MHARTHTHTHTRARTHARNIVAWFGPFAPSLLDKVSGTLRQKWFHGMIDKDAAEAYLATMPEGACACVRVCACARVCVWMCTCACVCVCSRARTCAW